MDWFTHADRRARLSKKTLSSPVFNLFDWIERIEKSMGSPTNTQNDRGPKTAASFIKQNNYINKKLIYGFCTVSPLLWRYKLGDAALHLPFVIPRCQVHVLRQRLAEICSAQNMTSGPPEMHPHEPRGLIYRCSVHEPFLSCHA